MIYKQLKKTIHSSIEILKICQKGLFTFIREHKIQCTESVLFTVL